MTYNTISEEVLRQAADIMGPESNFHIILEYGKNYREAGLNPVYYTDDLEKIVYVTTEEKMKGVKFN